MRQIITWLGRTIHWRALGMPLGASIAVIALVAGGIGHDVAAGAQAGPRIIYVPDPTRPTFDVRAVSARGVQVATSAAHVRHLASSADALIIDGSQLDAVGAGDWLKAQRNQGRIIMAVNAPMDALVQAAGSPFDHVGSFRMDWQGTPFYSYVAQTPPGRTPAYQSQGSAPLNSLDFLLHVVRQRHQEHSGALTLPPSPNPIPRPPPN